MGSLFSDPVELCNYIKSNNYILEREKREELISYLKSVDSITDDDLKFRLLFSVIKAQFKWNELTDELYFDQAITLGTLLGQSDHIIELLMMRGVFYLLQANEPLDENYGIADEYFMKCWSLQTWDDRDEFVVDWPWKKVEECSPVPLEERMGLYQYLKEFFAQQDPNEYFEMLLIQLRANESVKLRKDGKLKEFLNNFIAISLNMPQKMRAMDHAREEFREEKENDLSWQIFDIATVYHYLAISYLFNSDNENARINFEESLYYREKRSHYLDKIATFGNLTQVYSILDDSHNALSLLQQSNDFILDNGMEIDLIKNYLIMVDLHISDGEFANAIKFAEKCIKLAEKFDKKGDLEMALAKIERCNEQIKLDNISVKKKE
ncbi:MAG: tetratricopeptide repeat protein [Candidatus Heimdallarchaeota archaeon]|nr:tetratricopeptide repeat protein [Candidatus Heimdallarchaeota archaeon]